MNQIDRKITIGIPTYYGGLGLVKTVRSIMASEGVEPFRLVVCVDGNPLDPVIEANLKELGVEVVLSAERGGQVARIRQIIGLSRSDIVILTQDDILFERDTVREILKTFELHPKTTMVSTAALPLSATAWFERVIHAGFDITQEFEALWNGGNNYLRACGRCLAFRREMAEIIRDEIQEEVISCDAHFYFINRQYGGVFRRADKAVYRFRSPKTLRDHLKQSQKHLALPEELWKYRKIDFHKESSIPVVPRIRAALIGFVRNPFWSTLYFGVLLYTRLKKNPFLKATRFWDTDESTKEI